MQLKDIPAFNITGDSGTGDSIIRDSQNGNHLPDYEGYCLCYSGAASKLPPYLFKTWIADNGERAWWCCNKLLERS